jgi:hypothetical protein
MNAFQIALAEYKAAVLDAERDAVTETQRGMHELHVQGLADIEKEYALTADPYACRMMIECELEMLKGDILSGASASDMMKAVVKLRDAALDAYRGPNPREGDTPMEPNRPRSPSPSLRASVKPEDDADR